MGRINALFSELWAWFSGRTERERRLLAVMAAAVLTFVLFITFFTLGNSASAYRKRTELKRTKLKEAQLLAENFSQAERNRRAMEQRLSRNSIQLISYLGDKGQRVGLEIPTINPKGDVPIGDGKIIESSVELTLTDVELGKLVNFLSSVEQGPGLVKVTYLRLEPRPSNKVVTAWATIATYKLKSSN